MNEHTHTLGEREQKLWHTFDLRNKFLHCHIRQVSSVQCVFVLVFWVATATVIAEWTASTLVFLTCLSYCCSSLCHALSIQIQSRFWASISCCCFNLNCDLSTLHSSLDLHFALSVNALYSEGVSLISFAHSLSCSFHFISLHFVSFNYNPFLFSFHSI